MIKNKQPAQKRGTKTVLKYDFLIIKKVWTLVPAFVICLVINALVWAFIDSLAVYFRNAMFNALDTSTHFWDVAQYIVALGIFYLVIFVPHHLYHHFINPILDNKLRHKIHEELYAKAQSMDIACYDDPDFYNQFVWAMNESDSRAVAVVGQMATVIHRLGAVSAITVILLDINVWVGILMFAGVIATMVVDQFGNKLWVKQSEECMPLWRQSDYYVRTFYLADYAKEMRSGDMADMMADAFEVNQDLCVEKEMQYGKKFAFLYGVLWQLFRRGTYYGTVLIMIGDLMAGRVLLGGFAAALTAFTGNGLYLAIVGGCFVFSVISVIIQVIYYKVTHGKRVFLMAPVHHHFQQKGYSETKISYAYFLITLLLGLVCVLTV